MDENLKPYTLDELNQWEQRALELGGSCPEARLKATVGALEAAVAANGSLGGFRAGMNWMRLLCAEAVKLAASQPENESHKEAFLRMSRNLEKLSVDSQTR